eukprot:TRINITY_DN113468_c0_g1_i1.p1 TRINITY_DN113468_c0_g1~~TRINITY_DN113468_c0_g1_i1.p1  ORF type:complete len:154 (+),score=13.91 TRINITY_DN113468_c0_g1_i1:52-513(+)
MAVSPWQTLRDTSTKDDHHVQQLYRSGTALGHCRLDTVGHLRPCDSKHAPIAFYRSYGEWFEKGRKAPKTEPSMLSMSSRFWPYGKDVTKLYQTTDRSNLYELDDRRVKAARPYIPPRDGSLPDLRSYREGGSRHGTLIDETYHRTYDRCVTR